jgi:hypothetical protein
VITRRAGTPGRHDLDDICRPAPEALSTEMRDAAHGAGPRAKLT